MKVKIIKTSKPTYWYKNKIGEVFEVIRGVIFPLTAGKRKGFEVKNPEVADYGYYVDLEDVEIVFEELE